MRYDYKDIKKLIEESESYHSQSIKPKLERNLNWYKGNYNSDSQEYNYKLNLAYSTAQVLLTSVYSKDPEFSYQINGDIEDHIKTILMDPDLDIDLDIDLLEKALEKTTKIYFTEMKSRATNKRAILDAVWAGFGVTKMGYIIDLDNSIKELKKTNQDEYIRLAETLDFSDVIIKDEPFKIRINPMNILLPCYAESLYELDWVCQKSYLKQDDALRLYKKRLPTNACLTLGDNRKPDMVKIYEFHSLDPSFPYICVLAEGHNDFLEIKPHPLYDGKKIKNMFQFVWFNDGLDTPYPTADLTLVEDQIKEVNISVSRRVELIKRNSAIYKANGVWERRELDKLKKAKDGEVINAIDASATLEQLPLLTLGEEFYANINAMRNEILEVLGLTDYAIGGNTQQRKATEAQIMEKSRVDRVQTRINAIEDFVFNQADTFIEIMKQYKVVNQTLSIAMPGSKIFKFDFNGQLLKAMDINVQVVAGSTISLDKDSELRRINQLAQIASQFPQNVNAKELFKQMIIKSGFSGEADKFLKDEEPLPLPQAKKPKGMEPIPGIPSPTPMEMGSIPAMEQGLA